MVNIVGTGSNNPITDEEKTTWGEINETKCKMRIPRWNPKRQLPMPES